MADTIANPGEFDLGIDERLEALYLGLADAGFPIGVRERSIVARLLLYQAECAPGRLSVDSLRSDLGPVLAKSIDARDAFGRCFDEAFLSQSLGNLAVSLGQAKAAHRQKGSTGWRLPLLRPWVLWIIVAIAVVLAASWGWMHLPELWRPSEGTGAKIPAQAEAARQPEEKRAQSGESGSTTDASAAMIARMQPVARRLNAAISGAAAMTPRQIAVNLAGSSPAGMSWQSYLRTFATDLDARPDAPLKLDDENKGRLLISAARLDDAGGDVGIAAATELLKSVAEPSGAAQPDRIDLPIPTLKDHFTAPWWASVIPPLIPLAIFAGWLIRRTARKRAYLESRQPEAPPVVHNLVSRAFEQGAADQTALAIASQRLYRRVLGSFSNDLAADATVDATVANGGRFQPVWARRRLEPEYLFLVAVDGWSDVGADRMVALVGQLRRFGLPVEQYFIRLEHNLVYRAHGEANIRLADLVARYPDHRLVFMGAGTELLNPVTFEPWPWARDIEKWEVRTVLSPVREEEWGRREIALAGLFASPLFSATTVGLSHLAELLERSGMPEPDRFRPGSYPQPRSWRFRPLRWLEPIDEGDAEWDKLWQELRRHLTGQRTGIHGSKRADHPALVWLAACAVYPAVRWDLSVYLALGLTPDGELRGTDERSTSLYDEDTAVRLAELPWFREGHMPDWLRLRLVATLDPSTRRDVIQLLEKLLQDARDESAAGLSGVSLSIAKARATLPHPAQYPLQDQVFLEEMARYSGLALEATRNIRELLGRMTQSFWFREWATGLVLMLYSVAAAILVPWPVDGPLPTAAWLPVMALLLGLLAWPLARQVAGFADSRDQRAHSRMQSTRQSLAGAYASGRQRLADWQVTRLRRRGYTEVHVGQTGAMRWLKPGGGEQFRDLAIAPEMVIVPAGSFMMGAPMDEIGRADSEGPQHKVSLPAPFAVSRFAVTFADWDAAQAHPDWQRLTGLDPRQPADYGWGRGHLPVINVSWEDARAYCVWLSAITGQSYRLPSEAEWEYVARAGTTTPFWWGAEISTEQANYDGNHTYGAGTKGQFRQRIVPVDSFKPNPWGLYQVHGNVWEWCQDDWHRNYEGAPTDGLVWLNVSDVSRVLRGGSWGDAPKYLRAALRFRDLPDRRDGPVGFRLVRTLNTLP